MVPFSVSQIQIQDRRNVVLIGDSYLEGNSQQLGSAFIRNFPQWHFFNYADGGSGYTFGGSHGYSFKQQIENAIANIQSEHSISTSDVSHVFIIGGRNDCGGQTSDNTPDENTLTNAAIDAMNAAKNGFTNAKVYVIPCLYDWKLPNVNLTIGEGYIRNAAQQAGCWCAYNAWSLGVGLMDELFVGGTDIHPNAAGGDYMSKAIMKAVINNNPNMIRTRQYQTDTITFTLDDLGICIKGAVTLGISGVFVQRQNMPNWLKPAASNEDDWYTDGSTMNIKFGLQSFFACNSSNLDKTCGYYIAKEGLTSYGASPGDTIRFTTLTTSALC